MDPLKLTEVGNLSTWVWGEKTHRSEEGCQASCENQNPWGQTLWVQNDNYVSVSPDTF